LIFKKILIITKLEGIIITNNQNINNFDCLFKRSLFLNSKLINSIPWINCDRILIINIGTTDGSQIFLVYFISVADPGGARGGDRPPKFFLGGRRPPENFEKKVKTH
jgi:hypothetical protein